MTLIQKINSYISAGFSWLKLILLVVVIFTIGIALYYVLGKNGMVIGIFRKLISGMKSGKGEEKQEATEISDVSNNTKVDTATLSTNKVVDDRLNSIDNLLKAIEDRK